MDRVFQEAPTSKGLTSQALCDRINSMDSFPSSISKSSQEHVMSQRHPKWLPDQRITEPTEGVFFVEGPASNWIIVREGDDFILIDGGYPHHVEHVLASIRHAGLEPAQAKAMLITHGHVDHTGSAAHFSKEYGTPILCSPEEVAHVRGQEKHQVTLGQVLRRAWRPRVFRWMLHVIGAGALSAEPATKARAWDTDELQAFPGSPLAVLVPGHTPGHTAFFLPKAQAVATGDALVTGHPLSKETGLQMLHPMFHSRPDEVLETLQRLSDVDASLILPGHGPALRKRLGDAVAGISAG
jgi:glyoxylase-like metal-dependent hydrolase (beta-lactamase superfamily II)